ncbi:hypothetical protein [Amycolatopsis sp. KNN50.9b]|uniref:hypothetical protein n=1 Tax=Amycolatopsis sp. KNN50.9b TaxID=2018303 RepID=UPI001177A99A|nr:hypothetical protein [Amycolatopsis sp. KNN50.9b]
MLPTTTAQQRQHPVAAATPSATGQPVATVAAAPRTAPAPAQAAPPRPQNRPAHGTPAPARPATVHTEHTTEQTEPPGERPEHRHVPDLPALRIVCWQLALVLGLVAIGRPWPVVAGLLTTAAGLLVWTAGRVGGRWLSDEVALRVRLLLRRRRAAGRRDLLDTLAPGARVGTAELAGVPAGVISRDEELVAVLRPSGDDPGAFARLALAGALVTGTGEPPAIRLQLVLHRGPRQTDATRAWLAVRALRDPAVAADAELLAALTSVVRRAHRKLRGAGLGAVALTDQELLATLAALTHTGPGRDAVAEERRYWRAGPITQIGVRVTGLGARPPRARVHALHQLLAAVPGAACTVAVTVPGHDAVLRVAATTDTAADTAVTRLLWAPPAGLHLERMDNQHAPAVAASLPIGGKP